MYKMWKTRTLKPYILTNSSSSAFRKIIPSLYLKRKRHGHTRGILKRWTCEIVLFDPQRRTKPVLTLDCKSNFASTKADRVQSGLSLIHVIGNIGIRGFLTWKQINQQQNVTSSEDWTGNLYHSGLMHVLVRRSLKCLSFKHYLILGLGWFS